MKSREGSVQEQVALTSNYSTGLNAPVMVVGYGNTLRRDDGIGQVIAPELARLLCERGIKAEFLTCHQLVPEMALDLVDGNYGAVIFVDASITCAPAKWELAALEFGAPKPLADPHHLSPVSLMEMACFLGESQPRAFVLSLGAVDFSLGEGFSEEISNILGCIEEMSDAIFYCLTDESRSS